MPYLTWNQVPELSGFNRKQQRFLLKAAQSLQDRKDPWFRLCLGLLFGGWVGLWTYMMSNLLGAGWHNGWMVIGAFGAGTGGILFSHIQLSNLRPYLAQAIQKHGVELETIG